MGPRPANPTLCPCVVRQPRNFYYTNGRSVVVRPRNRRRGSRNLCASLFRRWNANCTNNNFCTPMASSLVYYGLWTMRPLIKCPPPSPAHFTCPCCPHDNHRLFWVGHEFTESLRRDVYEQQVNHHGFKLAKLRITK